MTIFMLDHPSLWGQYFSSLTSGTRAEEAGEES